MENPLTRFNSILNQQGSGLLSDTIADDLRLAIFQGTIPPGSSLPEEQIATAVGTSRGPVKEAIRQLALEGLVEDKPRRMAYVRVWTAKDIAEVASLRTSLETLAAQLARQHMTAEDLTELRRCVDCMWQAVNVSDSRELSILNMAFHRAMWSASKHSLLQGILESLKSQIHMTVSSALIPTGPFDPRSDAQRLAFSHQKLLDALTDKRLDLVAMIHEHINDPIDRLIQMMEKQHQTDLYYTAAAFAQESQHLD